MTDAQSRDDSRTQLARNHLKALERKFGGRLGMFALDTSNGVILSNRATERFPLCSTFKVMVASAILKRSQQESDLLQRRIQYQPSQIVDYSPITQKHVTEGMTVANLCAAALQYSDNTAGNLLIRLLDGPAAVTAFARSIGDEHFRLDRWETALNTCIPGDLRDTTTPQAMGDSLNRLVLGDALFPAQRKQLQNWLCGNTTGAARIQAGVPTGWRVGDKTGTGDYGTANDVAVVWPPHQSLRQNPIVIAVYTTQPLKEAHAHSEVVASATRIVSEWVKAA